MILAAGRGERLRPLTDKLPKPLVPVAGKPLIVYHLESLAAAGFTEVLVNLAHLGEMIADALGDGRRWGLQITYSRETEALESAGGIRQALAWLSPDGNAPFAVINADVFTDWPMARLHDMANRLSTVERSSAHGGEEQRLAELVLVPNPDFHPRGDFGLTADQLVQNLAVDQVGYTFAGIGVYAPSLLASVALGEKKPLAPLLRDAAAAGRVGGQVWPGHWTDVGTLERLQVLEAMLAKP